MALLNYGLTYQQAVNQNFLGYNVEDNSQYLKLLFTSDGHIISHHKDYLPTFDPNITNHRGLLTASLLTSSKDDISSSSTKIVTSNAIWDYLDTTYKSAIKAAETMRFKGTIGYKDDNYYHIPVNGTETAGFPGSCSVGDSYRIETGGQRYGGVVCESGDILVCIKDGSSNINSKDYWTVVQTNIGGTSTFNFNGQGYNLYTSTIYSNIPKLFGPTTSGTAGYILKANGTKDGVDQAPTWVNPGDLSVKSATTATTAITAGKVSNALSFGTGLNFNVGSFDGSTSVQLALQKATSNSDSNKHIGGVIVDTTYLTLNSDGVLGIDAQQFANALGNLDSITSTLSAGSNAQGGVDLILTNGNNSANRVNIKGSNGVIVQYQNSAINISTSITNTWRPIMVGTETINQNATLKFIPGNSVAAVILDNSDTNEFELGFNIYWTKLDTDSEGNMIETPEY